MSNTNKIYDLIIIGGGPAGVSAAIYAARFGLDFILLTEKIGGSVSEAYLIGNYPGFTEISGKELIDNFQKQLTALKVEIVSQKAEKIKINPEQTFTIITEEQNFQTKTVLLTTGSLRKKLNVPGETEFLHRGVAYCALCDGPLFRDKIVTVVGGGNAGLSAAVYLASLAQKVYLIEALDYLPGETHWQKQLTELKNVKIILNNQITAITGEKRVTGLTLKNPYQGKNNLETAGIFVEIGNQPDDLLAEQLKLTRDSGGYIQIQAGGQTSQAGIWAAGDLTTGSDYLQQIITAASEGAIAANSIYQFLKH